MARFRNQVHLPFHSPIFHPDLVNTSDAIIGKAGYSTIAEAFHAGVPFGFVPRLGFREAPILENFILENLHGFRIEEEAFFTGQWQRPLDKLLDVPVVRSMNSNGAGQAAKFIADIMQK